MTINLRPLTELPPKDFTAPLNAGTSILVLLVYEDGKTTKGWYDSHRGWRRSGFKRTLRIANDKAKPIGWRKL